MLASAEGTKPAHDPKGKKGGAGTSTNRRSPALSPAAAGTPGDEEETQLVETPTEEGTQTVDESMDEERTQEQDGDDDEEPIEWPDTPPREVLQVS